MNFTNDYIFARFERISFKLSQRKHGETDVFAGYFNLGKIPNLEGALSSSFNGYSLTGLYN